MLLEHLPRASHLRSARSRDVEAYERVAALPPPPPEAPDLAEFPAHVELLAALYDRIGDLMQVTVAAAGSKKKLRLRPWKRPETAADILTRHQVQRNKEHLDQVITFTSGATPPPPEPATTTTGLSRVRR